MPEFSSEAEVAAAIKQAIESGVPNAAAEVKVNGGGHYELVVRSPAFDGKKTLDKQRMVYATITELMAGHDAPVHAIDSMKTLLPDG